ncbi:hypothetical protein D3C73_1425610 [compost metagenome]
MQRPGDLGQFTLDQRLGQIIEATAAHLFGHVERVETGGQCLGANVRSQFRWYGIGTVDGLLMGQQFFFDKAAHGLDQHVLLLGQLKIHGGRTCGSITGR